MGLAASCCGKNRKEHDARPTFEVGSPAPSPRGACDDGTSSVESPYYDFVLDVVSDLDEDEVCSRQCCFEECWSSRERDGSRTHPRDLLEASKECLEQHESRIATPETLLPTARDSATSAAHQIASSSA
ncbi:unnamed protein product [Vitrella brassicaformis CCMP3155]|uniref:Uncharacterized protein n=1 Tax=Vitrella brassicaformis (strain CCMP3155) TaxID=1169540 RepID=A0A0G4EME3_VITBC|nr:unnamed protein product [Vitrella brassicaformis CCMP3155]|eukprot:CEL98555.1 unnamed protein product [Vitrella brassicaformis CCMP3155]